ncbi:hypothetical protein C5167_019755 [Papaver somniferum]|uniref:NADP-dependent oxidoreductase domain-containing protein n=1 Tax=Papaver somniferum TaxID=3469 RepID=A0A4Y7IR16_PAPSO|nr:hypothetical protein C5167_019755 [Papaver somniferum]
MEKVIPGVTLNSGSVMPVLGMGTAAYPLVESEEVKLAILNAIKNGYRHLDTAALYQSEESLGEAVSEAIQIGLTKSRDELFITSKLWSCDAHPDRVVPALQNSLRKLKLEYLDLYLIHWPLSSNPAAGHADFCKANNIILTAYSPLGGKGTPWGSNAVHEERVLHEIAEAKGKTHAQVCLRWIFEQGVSLLVKSYNKQRMKENMMIFDWELTQDELEKISKIPQRRGLPGDIFVSELEAAPFKTIEELWDGEV